jgi:hypothetical protein
VGRILIDDDAMHNLRVVSIDSSSRRQHVRLSGARISTHAGAEPDLSDQLCVP